MYVPDPESEGEEDRCKKERLCAVPAETVLLMYVCAVKQILRTTRFCAWRRVVIYLWLFVLRIVPETKKKGKLVVFWCRQSRPFYLKPAEFAPAIFWGVRRWYI